MTQQALQDPLSYEQLAQYICDMFGLHLPFNQLLGMEIVRSESDEVEIRLPWQDKLMGNPAHKILHGGVTASILDTVGGLVAILQTFKDMDPIRVEDVKARLPNAGTIDMRVDYLRPGKGEMFIATAQVIRKGNKITVCRMELHNEQGTHIAFGTGTYSV